MGNDVSSPHPNVNLLHRGWRSLADVRIRHFSRWRSTTNIRRQNSHNSPPPPDPQPIMPMLTINSIQRNNSLRVAQTNSILRNASCSASIDVSQEDSGRKGTVAVASGGSGSPRVTFDLPTSKPEDVSLSEFNGLLPFEDSKGVVNNEDERRVRRTSTSKVPTELIQSQDMIRLDGNDELLSHPDKAANSLKAGSLPQAPLRFNHSSGEIRRQSLAIRRQSNAELATKMSSKRKASKRPTLSSAQIILIRNAWSHLSATKGAYFLGNSVMQRLFFKTPAVKDTYLKCKLTGSITNHDILLKEHGKMVANMVDQIIKSLEDLEACTPMLEEIGRQHSKLAGFAPKFWNMFAEAFIDCTIEWGEKSRRVEDSRMAWALIVSFMSDKIKQGHYEARRNSINQASPTSPIAP